MAAPVNDAYVGESGATISAGTPPLFAVSCAQAAFCSAGAVAILHNLAAASCAQAIASDGVAVTSTVTTGTILNHSTNTIASVNPAATNSGPFIVNGNSNSPNTGNNVGQAGVMAYSGVTYTPYLGAQGSILTDGGGHEDYWGNEVYAYDIAAKTWSRLSMPLGLTGTGLWQDVVGGNGYFGDGTYGECYADASATTTLQTQPAPAHSYSQRFCVAPGVAGSGSKGAYVSMSRTATSRGGNRGASYVHVFDLETKVWSRYSTNSFANVRNIFDGDAPIDKPFAYDATRNKAYCFPYDAAVYPFNFGTKAWGNEVTLGGAPAAAQSLGMFAHLPSLDLLFHLYSTVSGFRVARADLTGQWKTPGWTGTPPTAGGACWDSDNGCVWVYPASPIGGKTLYKLTPPADPLNQPWVWSSQTFSGVAPNDAFPTAISGWHNFVYVSALRSAFWVVDATKPVQQFVLS